jgi:hypothetical protein
MRASTHLQLAQYIPRMYSLPDTFFTAREGTHKSAKARRSCRGRNRVGAAWSTWLLLTDEPSHGAETCPPSAISPLPQKVSGRERECRVLSISSKQKQKVICKRCRVHSPTCSFLTIFDQPCSHVGFILLLARFSPFLTNHVAM